MALGSAVFVGSIRRGVAGGLAEPQEGFEDLDLRAVQLGRLLAQEGRAVVGAELFVDLALGGLHVAVEGLLGLLGEVLDDLRLGPPEDERLERPGQQRAVLGLEGAAAGGVLLEDGRRRRASRG